MSYKPSGPKLKIEKITFVRNGVDGMQHWAVLFSEGSSTERMIGIVFDKKHYVAVYSVDLLALGHVGYQHKNEPKNAFRAEYYESALRAAIKQHQKDQDKERDHARTTVA